jgi:hypothetical protein
MQQTHFRMRNALLLGLVTASLAMACGGVGPTAQGQPGPAIHASEGTVTLETPAGQAAAELVATPREIGPDGTVILQVMNRGDVPLTYGRPIQVERWDGTSWVETEESRESAWTMELLIVQPGAPGVEQRWPFLETSRPDPGWYRFTKRVQPDTGAGPTPVAVRTRVQVTDRDASTPTW